MKIDLTQEQWEKCIAVMEWRKARTDDVELIASLDKAIKVIRDGLTKSIN